MAEILREEEKKMLEYLKEVELRLTKLHKSLPAITAFRLEMVKLKSHLSNVIDRFDWLEVEE